MAYQAATDTPTMQPGTTTTNTHTSDPSAHQSAHPPAHQSAHQSAQQFGHQPALQLSHPAGGPSGISASAAGLLLATLLAVTVGYLLACWLWPFGPCRRCDGAGRRDRWIGTSSRTCTRCDGTGYALRIGRHAINHLRDLRRRANP